jgi:hypothetical protein
MYFKKIRIHCLYLHYNLILPVTQNWIRSFDFSKVFYIIFDATSGIATARKIYLCIRYRRDFLKSFGDKYTLLYMKIKVFFWLITLLQKKKKYF